MADGVKMYCWCDTKRDDNQENNTLDDITTFDVIIPSCWSSRFLLDTILYCSNQRDKIILIKLIDGKIGIGF